eukprot:3245071-Prymnesium_polylepis.1
MGKRAESKVVASREAAGVYHSNAGAPTNDEPAHARPLTSRRSPSRVSRTVTLTPSPPLRAALEPAAYGINGVPEELQRRLLDELRAGAVGAECAGKLEPRAVDVWRRLAAAEQVTAARCQSDESA